MNNSNYGYPRSGYTPPYASTPSNVRLNRPRFAYSGPPFYPRPRSSASKPNPDSFSESMINNYGNSTSRIDMSFGSENGLYDDSYKNSSGSNYYSANDTFYSEPSHPLDSPMRGSMSSMRNNFILSDLHKTGTHSNSHLQHGTSNYNCNNSLYGMNNDEQLKGVVQKALLSSLGFPNKKQTFSARKFSKAKRKMAAQPSLWKCELCSLDFTSQIPYDMHLRGAKHAKKLKAKEALLVVQSKAPVGICGEKMFFCELCNVTANSSLQFQTHLDGNKHKNKLNPKESKDPSQSDAKETSSNDAEENISKINTNGKANGSLTRPLPSDFGEPQPTKISKFSCDICSVFMNSSVQLQQHLSSKKHHNKVEGKPIIKGKKNKMDKNDISNSDTGIASADSELTTSNEAAKTIVGVKTLSSSFVQGGTLQ